MGNAGFIHHQPYINQEWTEGTWILGLKCTSLNYGHFSGPCYKGAVLSGGDVIRRNPDVESYANSEHLLDYKPNYLYISRMCWLLHDFRNHSYKLGKCLP